MSREAEFHFALAACLQGLVTRAQLLDCAAAWLNELDCARLAPGHSPRSPATLLSEAGLVGEGAGALLLARLQEEPLPAVDSDLRRSLLDLHPPPDVRAWILALPERTHAAFEPLPRDERYRLGAEIARGGLGKVVEAEDRDLRRAVAIKLVLTGAPGDTVGRFVREARIAARLDHPNIVPVFDFGDMPGPGGGRELFLCMKRVRGQDLGAVIRAMSAGDAAAGGKFSRARLLAIFQDVCLGMAFAHSKGVIHRDLKPSNIMIGDYGETLIVDWGLAKALGEPDLPGPRGPVVSVAPAPKPATDTSQLTLMGDVLGTPAYMSPEQASGRLDALDIRSDLYSLGAILFAILTWRPPLEGSTQQDLLAKARAGLIQPPSRLIASLKDGRIPEPVPPELDALCVKAMAPAREDRFSDALELHHEVQLFLEGVRERERGRKEAEERLRRGRERLARFRELRGLVEDQEREVRRLGREIPSYESVESKKPLWDAELRLRELLEERIRCIAETGSELQLALAAEPGFPPAEEAQCELAMDRFLDAESVGDRNEMLLQRSLLAMHDKPGTFRARLEAPGRLTLRAFRFECGCLEPVRLEGWSAVCDSDRIVPWRRGRPDAKTVADLSDRGVPRLVTSPSPSPFGHRAGCVRKEVAGAEVLAAPWQERGRRLTPGEERSLGRTPLLDVELPQGSWRCVLRHPGHPDTVVPVRIDRAGAWTQDVTLYRAGEIPEGFVHVTGGPFLFGGAGTGDPVKSVETRTEDVFVSRLPVTAAEWLEFLNDLSANGKAEEARTRQPREGNLPFFLEEPGPAGPVFRLSPVAESPERTWRPDWPVFSVNWFDALAYCAWRSAREGRVYRLLHEEEFEKAARGVDARLWPFGNLYDANYSHTVSSLKGRARPLPVGSHPTDESPFGVRDLSGGVLTWCLNRLEEHSAVFCASRGGSWMSGERQAACAYRQGLSPVSTSMLMGLRLACDPWAWE